MATTNNIGLYCFNTGEEDAKTSLEALFGAGNSNMKKIDDAIGELRKKSFIVNTEEELNALLTEENLGKTVSYNGALYVIAEGGSSNASIAVGDTIDTLYFNTSATPDLEAIKASSSIIKGTDISTDFENWYFSFVVGSSRADDLNICFGFYDASSVQEGMFIITTESMENIIYASHAVADLGISTAGWQMDSIDAHTLFGEEGYDIIVKQVGGEEVWSSYISKEPFTSGGGIIAKPVGSEGGGLPSFAPEDAGKFLRVDSNGNIVAEAIAYAEGESF